MKTRARQTSFWIVPICLALWCNGCQPNEQQHVENLYAEQQSGDLSIAQIEAALRSSSPRVRATAASLLGGLDTEHAAATELIQQALRDAEPAVRAAAATAMGERGAMVELPQGAIEGLSLLVTDQVSLVRRRAIQALGLVATESAAQPLTVALDDPEADLRREAAKGLAEIASASTTEALIAALDDADVQVRAWAARALGAIGDDSARPALVSMAQSDNRYDRAAAIQAIEALDAQSAPSDQQSLVQ